MNCDPNNPPKQLKPPKEKDKVTFAEALGYESLYMLIRKQNNCLDENWSKDEYLQHVELYTDGVMKCGGLKKENDHIYDSVKKKIVTQTINAKQDLFCMMLDSQGVISKNNILYSWYRIIGSNPLIGEFVFSHTIQKDANGNNTSIDGFNQYSKGESLLCCLKFSDGIQRCEKIKYE